MATAIRQIRERVEEILENIVPDVEPSITLRKWLGSRDITTAEHTGSAATTTRQFQVVAYPVRDPGFLGGGSVDQWQTLRITIRYYISDRPDGWLEAHDLAAADSAAIYEQLLDDTQWVGTDAVGAAFGDAQPLTPSPTISNLGFQVLDYRVMYNRCSPGEGGSWTANFVTLGALLAYLDTQDDGTAARLINDRTRELIGVWVKGSVEGTWCDFSKADGTEFDDGTDLIKQAGASYTITYGVGIVITGAAVEFYGFGRLANTDLLFTGTTTIYRREKLHKYTSQADIDGVTGTTDQVVALVNAAGALVNHERWNGASWDIISAGGGGGLVSEHTTLSDLFASVGSAGSRAVLKTSADALVAMAYHDGTRWRLDGCIDFAAASTEGATIFSGYLATEAGRTLSWTAAGLRISSTTQGYTFFQFAEDPLVIRTDINAIAVTASVAYDTTASTNKNLYISAIAGVAGARTRVYGGGAQTFGGKNRAITLWGAIGSPSAGASGFTTDGSTSHEVSMHVGWTEGANSCATASIVDGATRSDGESQQNQFTPASYTDGVKEIGLNTGYGIGDSDISKLYVVAS